MSVTSRASGKDRSDDAPSTGRWSPSEATLVRAAGFVHLLVMSFGLLSPQTFLGAWGLPHVEPATFERAWLVAYGALGVALLRALRSPRATGRLVVETVALVKLAFVLVVVADILARKLPAAAAVGVILDLIFGAALLRAGRRGSAPAP